MGGKEGSKDSTYERSKKNLASDIPGTNSANRFAL